MAKQRLPTSTHTHHTHTHTHTHRTHMHTKTYNRFLTLKILDKNSALQSVRLNMKSSTEGPKCKKNAAPATPQWRLFKIQTFKQGGRVILFFDLNWVHSHHVTQIFIAFFHACLEVTTKVLQVLILELPTNFSKQRYLKNREFVKNEDSLITKKIKIKYG